MEMKSVLSLVFSLSQLDKEAEIGFAYDKAMNPSNSDWRYTGNNTSWRKQSNASHAEWPLMLLEGRSNFVSSVKNL
jgi:hypothetical protein